MKIDASAAQGAPRPIYPKLSIVDRALAEFLTGDFWTHTLPALLDTPRSTAPAALAFRASQIVLNSRALFSDVTIQQMIDPSADGGRSSMESHHLFATAWLRK